MEYYVFQYHIFETLFHEYQTCTIKKTPTRQGEGFSGAGQLSVWLKDQRLENWKERRALALPYFLRSTTRLSRVRKPAIFSTPRSSGS